MGKRSSFDRVERDFYPTPLSAVLPLLPHLPAVDFTYWEPCAGDGALIDHLPGTARAVSDIEPQRADIAQCDALAWHLRYTINVDLIITNPPWDRKILHPMIEYFSSMKPTWLLFDADWMHTRQSAELIKHCRKIVSVGRVKWIPDSKMTGKDNCAWYLFDQSATGNAKFIGRTPK